MNDNPDSLEFRQPVDWQGLNLLDYPVLIKYPMDLSTVMDKLNEEKYELIEECLDDIQMIWDNCKSYNQKGCVIYLLNFSGSTLLLRNCKNLSKKWWKTIFLLFKSSEAVLIQIFRIFKQKYCAIKLKSRRKISRITSNDKSIKTTEKRRKKRKIVLRRRVRDYLSLKSQTCW